MKHLYVLQSANNLIKVGRSGSPRKRVQAFQSQFCVSVRLIKVYRDRGHEEQAVLAAMQPHQAFGEWFHDTPEARAALAAAIAAEVPFQVRVKAAFRPSRNNKQWHRKQIDDLTAAIRREGKRA